MLTLTEVTYQIGRERKLFDQASAQIWDGP